MNPLLQMTLLVAASRWERRRDLGNAIWDFTFTFAQVTAFITWFPGIIALVMWKFVALPDMWGLLLPGIALIAAVVTLMAACYMWFWQLIESMRPNGTMSRPEVWL